MPSSSTNTNKDVQSFILRKSPNKAMHFLNHRDRWLERDLLNIGTAIFNLEAILKLGKKVKKIAIPISRVSMSRVDLLKLQSELEDLVLNILVEKVKIEFTLDKREYQNRKDKLEMMYCDTICLFSGGVDSFSGILNWAKHFESVVGVSVIHGDQPWGSHIVDEIRSRIETQQNISFYKLYAPPMMSRGYSQLRGFLYCLYGAIFVSLFNARNLLITEVGPTMYQPRFSPFDTVTMTTHPFVLNKVKKVLDLLFRREVRLVIPYENMTKAEVVAASPLKDVLPFTHSCISLRLGRSDGTCYGCVIRKLGFLVSGVRDTDYSHDPIGDSGANADNLVSLARFSYDLLTDYKHMLASSVQNIEDFGKRDLYRRFALDTFAALYIYEKEIGTLNKNLLTIYVAAIEHITEAKLENRIAKVRRVTFKPNFKRTV